MAETFRIEFDWLDREMGSELDRAFAASIGMAVGEEYLTRLDDLGAKTVRNQILASAWHLAAWFAANWWRLRLGTRSRRLAERHRLAYGSQHGCRRRWLCLAQRRFCK